MYKLYIKVHSPLYWLQKISSNCYPQRCPSMVRFSQAPVVPYFGYYWGRSAALSPAAGTCALGSAAGRDSPAASDAISCSSCYSYNSAVGTRTETETPYESDYTVSSYTLTGLHARMSEALHATRQRTAGNTHSSASASASVTACRTASILGTEASSCKAGGRCNCTAARTDSPAFGYSAGCSWWRAIARESIPQVLQSAGLAWKWFILYTNFKLSPDQKLVIYVITDYGVYLTYLKEVVDSFNIRIVYVTSPAKCTFFFYRTNGDYPRLI